MGLCSRGRSDRLLGLFLQLVQMEPVPLGSSNATGYVWLEEWVEKMVEQSALGVLAADLLLGLQRVGKRHEIHPRIQSLETGAVQPRNQYSRDQSLASFSNQNR